MEVSKKRGKFILTRVFPYGAALISNGDNKVGMHSGEVERKRE